MTHHTVLMLGKALLLTMSVGGYVALFTIVLVWVADHKGA